jgi:hypothetical protein
MNLIKSVYIPIKTVSEANKTEHWTKKHKRHKAQRNAVEIYCGKLVTKMLELDSVPTMISLTRVAPRALDQGDNLPMALKSIRDYIANLLSPGLQIGRADDLDQFKWRYGQRRGAVREYAVIVEFYA